MIVVNKCKTPDGCAFDSCGRAHIFERSVLLIVQKQHTFKIADGQVRETVVVVVSRCAADSMKARVQTGAFRHVLEFAGTQIVIESHAVVWTIVGKEEIDLAIVVIVDETGACADHSFVLVSLLASLRCRHQPRLLRYIHELNLDLGAGL